MNFAENVNLLISQYRSKPLIRAIVLANQKAWQRVDDSATAVLNAFNVDTADLTRLKIVAKWVGQPFRGESIEAFRVFVKGRIAARRSRGAMPQISKVARILDETSRLFQIWPACVWVELYQGETELLTLQAKRELLDVAVGAGVSLVVVDVTEEAHAELGDPGSSLTLEVDVGGWGISIDPSVGSIAAVTL